MYQYLIKIFEYLLFNINEWYSNKSVLGLGADINRYASICAQIYALIII